MTGLLAMSVAAAEAAQDAQSTLTAKRPWIVDYGAGECSLGRQIGDDPKSLLVIRKTPGSGSTGVLWLREPPVAKGRSAPDRLSWEVDGVAHGSPLLRNRYYAGKIYTLPLETEGIIAQLTSARSLVFGGAEAFPVVVELRGMEKAVVAWRSCETETLRAWGVDPERHAALRSPVRTMKPVHQYISHNDYPDRAMRRGESGDVVMRLDVSADGKLKACTVVETSRSADLDRASCAIMRSRAEFVPAVDRGGRNVAGSLITKLNWRVYGS